MKSAFEERLSFRQKADGDSNHNAPASLPALRFTQVQAKAEGEGSDTEWSKNIARISEFAQDSVSGIAAQYNETSWFPVVHDAVSQYMEVSQFDCFRKCVQFQRLWAKFSVWVNVQLELELRCPLTFGCLSAVRLTAQRRRAFRSRVLHPV